MKFLFILFLCLGIFGCKSESDTENKVIITEEKNQEVSQKKEEIIEEQEKITNDNVKEKLMEYGKKNPETIVLIKTDKGDLKIKLYKDTPLHRANFILMAKEGCFNNSVFTRVTPQFMAQAGGTYDEETVKRRNGIGSYTIPAEIKTHHYHKFGALGAARSYNNNPDKRSSSKDFYFVEGAVYNSITLDKYEEVNKYKFPESHRAYYTKQPGAAHIDGQHTLFGEVIEGLDVIHKLTEVKTDSRDWPVTDIYIKEVLVLN